MLKNNKTEFVLKLIITVVLIVGLAIGSGLLLRKYISNTDGTMTIQVIDQNGELVINDKWKFSEGDTALGILKEHYTIRSNESFGMTIIYDINDVKTDGNHYFLALYNNDEMSMVGIDSIKLVDGIVLKFEVTLNTYYEE